MLRSILQPMCTQHVSISGQKEKPVHIFLSTLFGGISLVPQKLWPGFFEPLSAPLHSGQPTKWRHPWTTSSQLVLRLFVPWLVKPHVCKRIGAWRLSSSLSAACGNETECELRRHRQKTVPSASTSIRKHRTRTANERLAANVHGLQALPLA